MLTRQRGAARRHVLAGLALAALATGTLVADANPSRAPRASADEFRVACAVGPAVVEITTTLAYPPYGRMWGTGVIVGGDGDVLTNNHVISGAAKVELQIGGRHYDATVVATDVPDDLALVRTTASGLPVVRVGDSSELVPGQTVYSIGNGKGACRTPRASRGTVTALGRSTSISDELNGDPLELTGLIMSEVAVEPGYSGGALVNDRGEVVGILTAGNAGTACECYRSAFAIPMDKAMAIAQQMMSGLVSPRVHIGPTASLGVAAAPSLYVGGASFVTGALITYVAPGSPADLLGLKAGYQIVSVDDVPVCSALDLVLTMQQRRPGQRVHVGWTDDYWREHEADAVLISGPPQ